MRKISKEALRADTACPGARQGRATPRSAKQNAAPRGGACVVAWPLDAARNGVKSVHIIDGRVEHCLLLEILTDHGVGTMIKSK